MTNFLIKNAHGQGDYFDGMAVAINASDAEIGISAAEIIPNVLNLATRNAINEVIYMNDVYVIMNS